MLHPCHFIGAFDNDKDMTVYMHFCPRTFMTLLQNASLWGRFTRLLLSQTKLS